VAEETDVVIIADHEFLNDGKEEERKLEKVDGKEKMVKVQVEREGIQNLLKEFGTKLGKITVLFENSQEGPEEEEELGKHISLLLQAKESGSDNRVHILHFRKEVTSSLYSQFVNSAAGIPATV
jgi:hypothetical protein